MSSAKLVKISHSHNNGFSITRLLPYLMQNYLLCVKYSFSYHFFTYSNFALFSRSSLVLLTYHRGRKNLLSVALGLFVAFWKFRLGVFGDMGISSHILN